MDSFKDSIDTTLTSKAEQVVSAASESADLIKKRKKPVYSYSLSLDNNKRRQ